MHTDSKTPALKRTLGSFHLWGIAVGLVISGEYFGWSYGWAQAGTLGFLVTALIVAAMYTAFIFSFTELTTSIPHAGGPFAYAYRAFGPVGGYIAGFATLVEFVFAPPAIAMAIGAYLNVQFPTLDPKWIAVGAYLVFMFLNLIGVSIAATFELIVTLLAIFELLVFMGVVSPGFSVANFVANGWAGSNEFSGTALSGIFAAIPFAIWFFLAIEGAAMAARMALAELPLITFLNEALIPYEQDEVTRLILDTHDAEAFLLLRHMTVGDFRNWLLSDAADSLTLARVAPGITPEMAAAVSKLMRNQDLILVARKCQVVTRFRNTIGLPGHLSVRLQPNHPTDDWQGIAATMLDGLLYGSGDAVIGINPASDNLAVLGDLNRMLDEVIQRFAIPTQSCILTHVTNTLQLIERGVPVDLVFQSVAGT